MKLFSSRIITKIFFRLVLPVAILVALFGLFTRSGQEIFRILELKKEIAELDNKLEERKMIAYELRRKKIIMEMDDFRNAVKKANGMMSTEGEIRIRVK